MLRSVRLFTKSSGAVRTAFQTRSVVSLPSLPYDVKAGIAPAISPEMMDLHFNKHHANYVNKTNTLIKGTRFEDMSLYDIIMESSKDARDAQVFNNATQHWNHSFFWRCMKPGGSGSVPEDLREAIEKSFGSVDKFKEIFTEYAVGVFGSGWTWLVVNQEGGLQIVNTSNASNPLVDKLVPILAIDVWEHAYYKDYANRRAEFVSQFWKVVDWDFVNQSRTIAVDPSSILLANPFKRS
eukprot:TRINITY_DN603_c0_g1_i1.p1 TRINITY_DN603_c0_g1~~TRINITY_DN603_c0_g1_i1.p1  ORF type:complete len:256 (+),score=140.32 TRINITY_DN603_c0_g1_i1:57-770(+)